MVQNQDNISLEIMLVLLKGRMHVRKIAQELGVPHSTVYRRVNEMVMENVLDFKMEGKNKVIFIKKGFQAKNYLFNAERYKFIKLLQTYPKLNIILEEMLAKTDAAMVILFGSHAKFIAKKDSDIDVYVETSDMQVKSKMELVNSKVQVKIGEFETESLLIKEIIKNHVIIKGVERYYEKIELFK
ncbi:MAG: nucleotidyltransferase domain-containing protein [Thermoplasmata archaeon]|nr:nucleotidyltransferase domain-containing protein [Thermoplasmata archaeon]